MAIWLNWVTASLMLPKPSAGLSFFVWLGPYYVHNNCVQTLKLSVRRDTSALYSSLVVVLQQSLSFRTCSADWNFRTQLCDNCCSWVASLNLVDTTWTKLLRASSKKVFNNIAYILFLQCNRARIQHLWMYLEDRGSFYRNRDVLVLLYLVSMVSSVHFPIRSVM